MHALKVAALLVFALLTMRAVSWFVQWVLARIVGLRGLARIVAGNLTAFAVFAGYLWWNLMPGEPMDFEALIFGIIVFGLCGLIDSRWQPLPALR